MTLSEKIKTIDGKIEKNKTQYNLDTEAVKISILYQEILGNMNF